MRTVAINASLLAGGSGYRRAGLSVYAEGLTRAMLAQDDPDVAAIALVPRGLGVPFTGGPGGRVVETSLAAESVARRIFWEQTSLSRVARANGAKLIHGLAGAVNAAGLPAIATVHDLAFMVGSPVHGGLQRAYLTAAARLTARRALRVITPSQSTADLVCERLGVPAERVAVIANGLPDALRRPGAAAITAFRNKYRLDEPYVLYLGTVEPRKGVTDLIRAFAKLPPAKRKGRCLVIAGAPGWGTDLVERVARESGVAAEIRWLGYLGDDDVPSALAGAEVFCYPSHHEGFGLPVAEAMRCGAAVVTTTATSMPEVIGDAGILVDPGSEQALSEAIETLLDNSGLRAELSTRGMERSMRFSWAETARRTRLVYAEVLDGLPR